MLNLSTQYRETLLSIWKRAEQESGSSAETLENWIISVSKWAQLEEYQQKLYLKADLWLPTNDEKELSTLVGLAILANGLNCSPVLLAKALLAEPVSSQQKAEQENQPPSRMSTLSSEGNRVATEKTNELLEHLSLMQATFEQALDEAGQKLGPQMFPATDLQSYLAEICDLLRQALNQN